MHWIHAPTSVQHGWKRKKANNKIEQIIVSQHRKKKKVWNSKSSDVKCLWNTNVSEGKLVHFIPFTHSHLCKYRCRDSPARRARRPSSQATHWVHAHGPAPGVCRNNTSADQFWKLLLCLSKMFKVPKTWGTFRCPACLKRYYRALAEQLHPNRTR